MSLEEAVNANTAAILKLIDVMQGQEPKAPPAKQLAPPKATPKAAPKPAPAHESAMPVAEFTEADVKAAVLELIQKRGRDAAVKLLASIGATKATEVEPADRAKFIADAKTLLAAKA